LAGFRRAVISDSGSARSKTSTQPTSNGYQSCGRTGRARGAFEANTGHLAWRFYTVPGDPAKPFENTAMKRAAATWDGEWWKLGGIGAAAPGGSAGPGNQPTPFSPKLMTYMLDGSLDWAGSRGQ
jgi:hypothetical protein